MRVAVYYNNRDVRVEERPVPQIGPGELLVRAEASGICGSDVMEWYRLPKAPLVLGHEVAGQVVAVGEGGGGLLTSNSRLLGEGRYRAGDRVVLAHHVPCNTCHYCLQGHHTVCDTLRSTSLDPGGFAELVRVPSINVDRGVFPLPEGVSYEEGSFTEPLACVVRGQRLADLRPGQSVLVIGSGIAGLLHIQLACALGVGPVVATDIVDYRLKAALRLGAAAALPAPQATPDRLRQIMGGSLANLVIVCTGAPAAIAQGLGLVERGGTVLLFAPPEPGVSLPLSGWEFWRDGITLTTSYAGSPADYATALELIRSRRVRVKEMITHRLSLAETGLGFQLVAQAQDSLKVIIEPWK